MIENNQDAGQSGRKGIRGPERLQAFNPHFINRQINHSQSFEVVSTAAGKRVGQVVEHTPGGRTFLRVLIVKCRREKARSPAFEHS